MAGDRFFSIHPRKGTNTILDHKTVSMVRTSYSAHQRAKEEGHSKGGGIIRTVDQNVLVGPDAFETYKKEDFTTEAKNVAAVSSKAAAPPSAPAPVGRDHLLLPACARQPLRRTSSSKRAESV